MTSFAQAESDLAETVQASIQAGDAAWSAGNYAAAVAAYKRAGQTGAAVIGPEIDSIGVPDATQKFTQQAWQVNAQLANVNSTTPQSGDALAASALAQEMLTLYQNAIAAGRRATTQMTDSGGGGVPTVVWVAGAAVVVGLIAGLVSARSRRRGRSLSGATTLRRKSPSKRTTLRA